MKETLAEIVDDIPAPLVPEVGVLLRIILLSDSPSKAIAKAQSTLLADASDAAADTVLRQLLKK